MIKPLFVIASSFVFITQAADPVFEKKITDLLTWMKDQGSEFADVEIRQSRENLMRGGYAKKDFKKGDQIIFVPYHAMVEKDKVFTETPLGKKVQIVKDEMLPNGMVWYPNVMYLSLMLMQEIKLGEESHYKHFLGNFPEVDDFPLTYDNKTLELLVGSPLLKRIAKVRKNNREDYDMLVAAVPEIGEFTFEQYLQGVMWGSSRNFGVTINGTKTNVMVPLCDMFNHAEGFQADWTFDNVRQGFVMKANKDIQKDEEIFDSYGVKSSYQFLLHYGFIFQDQRGKNEADEFLIDLDLNWQDPLYDQKFKEFLTDESPTKQSFWIKPEIAEGAMYKFLAYARFIGFKGDHLVLDEMSDQAYKREEKKADKSEQLLEEYVGQIFEEPLDILTEVSAWYIILWRVEDALRQYPTSLAEDIQILEQDDKVQILTDKDKKLTYNERNCVMLRRNDKLILESIKESAFSILELANMTRREAVSALMKKRKSFKRCMKYVQDKFIPLLPEDAKDVKVIDFGVKSEL